MLKQIDGFLQYASSSQGNTDRNNFETAFNSEKAQGPVVPVLSQSNESTDIVNNGTTKTISFTIFYSSNNAGVNLFNAFWTTLNTELSKSTVLTGSHIRKCNSNHDAMLPNGTSTEVSK